MYLTPVIVDYYDGVGDYTQNEGYFEAVGNGDWDVDWETDPGFLKTRLSKQEQEWHTIEFHVKLASSPVANDGIWEVWFDGEKQDWVRLQEKGGAPTLSPTGIPTSRHGSGFNSFTFFDNMTNWNHDWDHGDVEGFIYINDVVVSEQKIGHEYTVGDPIY